MLGSRIQTPLYLPLFWGICLISVTGSEVDYCTTSKTRVQLVFAIDKTNTFASSRPTSGRIASDLSKDIQASFPGSEFAVVSFADYPPITTGTIDDPGVDDSLNENEGLARTDGELAREEDCYDPLTNFTTDASALEKAIRKVETRTGGTGGYCESSLNAVVFAAASKTLGWVNGPMDANGLYVHKVIVMITDDCATRRLKHTHNRTRANLDGSDNCNKTLPPNNWEIREILVRNDITLIALFAQPGDNRPRPFAFYKNIFDQMRQVRYMAYPLDFLNAEKIKKDIMESMECEDPDPPPYNTLGY